MAAFATEYFGEIELTLSTEEAEALRVVLARIGGSPTGSPRRHTNAIAEALDKVLARDRMEIAADLGRTSEIRGYVMFYTDEDLFTRGMMEMFTGTGG